MQTIQVRILARPIAIAVASRERLLQRLEGLRLFPQHSVSASRIVERARIARPKRDGRLQLPHALLFVLFEESELPSQQDTRPHILWNHLKLLAQHLDHPL